MQRVKNEKDRLEGYVSSISRGPQAATKRQKALAVEPGRTGSSWRRAAMLTVIPPTLQEEQKHVLFKQMQRVKMKMKLLGRTVYCA
ncbi:hypothetical protein TNCT_167041 [Trichonephila clavata]|uniref:Uncharacterized protein n=1 Tax=Trichonephila clavata TaxID=2740835 RepID=A0A8X6LL44_TRICU|nr:hypothetical protein TNCT_167041 [Trichonephila clavata]